MPLLLYRTYLLFVKYVNNNIPSSYRVLVDSCNGTIIYRNSQYQTTIHNHPPQYTAQYTAQSHNYLPSTVVPFLGSCQSTYLTEYSRKSYELHARSSIHLPKPPLYHSFIRSMFTSPAPPPPGTHSPLTTSTSTPTSTPTPTTAPTTATTTSSSRGSRLRDLINIRNYAYSHLLSRDHNQGHEDSTIDTAATPSASSSSPHVSSPRSHNTTRPRSHTATATTRRDNLPWDPPPSPVGLVSGGHTLPNDRSIADPNTHQELTPNPEPPTEPLSRSRTVPDLEHNAAFGTQEPNTVMTRTRSATTGDSYPDMLPSIRFSAFYDPRSNRPSLSFTPMSRTLPTGKEVIRVGRYSERENHPPVPTNAPSAAPVGFKSKVVSRRHCEFWYEQNKWYIRDVKSSSGTFLNHIRLSAPGTESKPFPINDGDIVQLGIDFKGGEEMIYRCVKMRIELNRGWQAKPNSFKYVAPASYRTVP